MARTTQLDPAEVFGNLSVVESEEPLPDIRRGSRDGTPNPFEAPLRASVEHSTPYTFYVPADLVKRAVSLINTAARRLNVGARVVVNVERNDDGSIVKGDDGKAVPIVEQRGENRGKVMVRFQGRPERKQSQPRPYTIIKDPDNKEQRALRHVATKQIVARGTHEEMRAELKRRKDNNASEPSATDAA